MKLRPAFYPPPIFFCNGVLFDLNPNGLAALQPTAIFDGYCCFIFNSGGVLGRAIHLLKKILLPVPTSDHAPCDAVPVVFMSEELCKLLSLTLLYIYIKKNPRSDACRPSKAIGLFPLTRKGYRKHELQFVYVICAWCVCV